MFRNDAFYHESFFAEYEAADDNKWKCRECTVAFGKALGDISHSLQKFYQSIVLHEENALDAMFEQFRDLYLIVDEHSYRFREFNVNVPFVVGGKVHYIRETNAKRGQKEEISVDRCRWRETRTPLLKCVLCNFAADELAFQKVPGSFVLKSRHYYCPIIITPDKRRPHITKITGKIIFYNKSVIHDFPELEKVRTSFALNDLGNMSFYSIGYLFPLLIRKKLFSASVLSKISNIGAGTSTQSSANPVEAGKQKSSGCSVKVMEHKVQSTINLGSIEEAISSTGGFVNSSPVSSTALKEGANAQKRVRDIINRGYSTYSNRYKEVPVGNDFCALTSPLECFKLITKNVTTHTHQTLDKNDVGFFDPLFTIDGENVGRVLSLCRDVIISWKSVPASRILEFLLANGLTREDADVRAEQSTPPPAASTGTATEHDLCNTLVLNFGETVVRGRHRFPESTLVRRLKSEFLTAEVLRYDDLVFVSVVPNLPFKFCAKTGLYHTPNELGRVGDGRLDLIADSTLGCASLPIPFPQHNSATKDAYVGCSFRHVTQTYNSERTKFPSSTKVWSLTYPHTPFSSNNPFPLFNVWCMALIMCVSGHNQEDGIVVKKSSVERGLFQTLRFGNYKVAYRERSSLSGDKLFFQFYAKAGDDLLKDKLILEMGGEIDGASTFHTELRMEKKRRNGMSVISVFWNSETVRKLLSVRLERRFCNVRVITMDLTPLSVGDKLVSCTGQKGIVTCVMDDEDMPQVVSASFRGPPDVILHPTCLRRLTLSMVLEGVNRSENASGSPNGVSFPFLDYAFESHESKAAYDCKIGGLLRLAGEKHTGHVYCGKTGNRFRDQCTLFPMSYEMIPQHGAKEKDYGVSTNSRTDFLTGQMVRGKSHFGALGVSSMETEILIGHGAIVTLENLLFERSDDEFVRVSSNTYARMGRSSQRFLDDMRLMNFRFEMNTEPSISSKGLTPLDSGPHRSRKS